MNIIYATYNIHHNSIGVYTNAGYLLRIDCNEAEEGLKTTPCSECALNALATDEPLEYALLYLRAICRCGWMRKIPWRFGKKNLEQNRFAMYRDHSVALGFSHLQKAPMGKMISFAVKTLPFVDIPADGILLVYACIVNKNLNDIQKYGRYLYASLLFSSDPRHRVH